MVLTPARNALFWVAILSGVMVLAYPVSAGDVARIRIGEFSKRTNGTLRSASAGDTACYLSMTDDRGAAFDEMANYDFCEPKNIRRFKGRRLALSYEIASVLSAECDGNMDCGKSDRVALIKKIRLAPIPRRRK